MRSRVEGDIATFARMKNEGEGSVALSLRGFAPVDVATMASGGSARGATLASATAQLAALGDRLRAVEAADRAECVLLLADITALSNKVDASGIGDPAASPPARRKWSIALRKASGSSAELWIELVVVLLSSPRADEALRALNPALSAGDCARIFDMTAALLLKENRQAQTRVCLGKYVRDAQRCLDALAGAAPASADAAACGAALALAAGALAGVLASKRMYAKRAAGAEALAYDPRFLTFEFHKGWLLKPQQAALLTTFIDAVDETLGEGKAKSSLCHQMIMGAGKTAVIAPMLAITLARDDRLVIQVVPQALVTQVSVLLCTVTFHANHAHNLTRSP
jgi:hypothetical protein